MIASTYFGWLKCTCEEVRASVLAETGDENDETCPRCDALEKVIETEDALRDCSLKMIASVEYDLDDGWKQTTDRAINLSVVSLTIKDAP